MVFILSAMISMVLLIQFYTMMIVALLQLHFKQQILESNVATKKLKMMRTNHQSQEAKRQRHPLVSIRPAS